MLKNPIIKIKAIQKAKKSNCRYKVSAIGFNHKGDVLGTAYNTHRFTRKSGGIHAEINLIRKYKNQLKTILICRVGHSGELLPIECCDKCQKVCDKLGIKVISINN